MLYFSVYNAVRYYHAHYKYNIKHIIKHDARSLNSYNKSYNKCNKLIQISTVMIVYEQFMVVFAVY